ncbi:MAG: hypothetical protein ACE5GE_11505 [Phycisphaerae bacterium]
MGSVRMGPPRELVLQLRDACHTTHFIETGTHQGYTAHWAATCFGQVLTVEYSQELHAAAIEKWAHLGNVNFLYGDSRKVLAQIVPDLKSTAFFWLDAHWSGGPTYGQGDECPLLDELRIITAAARPHVILIDDARLFLSPPPPPHRPEQWPTLGDINDVLALSAHALTTAIVDDVIVTVPPGAERVLNKYRQSENDQSCPPLHRTSASTV